MNITGKNTSNKLWLQLAFAVVLAVSFFLPWVSWDGSLVKGSAMASGDFFKIAETKFGLSNPFPQFSFLFYIFWLIPLLAILTVVFVFLKKKTVSFSFIAGLIPLVFASGPGAIGNRTIGTAAAGGMLFGTVFGVIIIPGLYYIFAKISEKNILVADEVENPLTEKFDNHVEKVEEYA